MLEDPVLHPEKVKPGLPFIADKRLYKAFLFAVHIVKNGRSREDAVRISADYHHVTRLHLAMHLDEFLKAEREKK